MRCSITNKELISGFVVDPDALKEVKAKAKAFDILVKVLDLGETKIYGLSNEETEALKEVLGEYYGEI